MRRGFSIFLIAFFALGPLSVFIDSEEANLPACCRRHGTHHCALAMQMAAMMRQAASGATPIAEAPMACPHYPGMAALFTAPAPALTKNMANLAALRALANIALAGYTAPASAPIRIHAGRGPPRSNLG